MTCVLWHINSHRLSNAKSYLYSLVCRDCIIYRLHLCRGIRPSPNKCPRYDIKLFDVEVPALDIWRMWSTSSLPLLPGPLWSRVKSPDRVLSMCQIEQTMSTNKWLMLNCDLYSSTWRHLTVYKKELRPFKNIIYKICLQIIYKLWIIYE